MKTFILSLIMCLPTFSMAGGSGGGNGGDTVRMRFFSIGNNIIDYYQKGFEKIKSVVKDPEELRNYLTINVVQTSVDLLIDNMGNPVNAIGERNKIILYVGEAYKGLSWQYILKDQKAAQKLILHEMLRAHGVNDDDYYYSNIVLKEQDIVQGGAYKMKWALATNEIILSSLTLSFRNNTPEEEAALYQNAINEIKNINNVPYANLLSLQIYLSDAITSTKMYAEKKITLMRKDLRQTKEMIPMVDELAYESIRSKKIRTSTLKRLALMVLRDFSYKYSDYSQAGQEVFSSSLEFVLDTLNSDEQFRSECINLNMILEDAIQGINLGAPKREILKRLQMSVHSLQQNQC